MVMYIRYYHCIRGCKSKNTIEQVWFSSERILHTAQVQYKEPCGVASATIYILSLRMIMTFPRNSGFKSSKHSILHEIPTTCLGIKPTQLEVLYASYTSLIQRVSKHSMRSVSLKDIYIYTLYISISLSSSIMQQCSIQ